MRKIIRDVKSELKSARRQHPADRKPWNGKSLTGMVGIVSAEAGEAQSAANKLQYEDIGTLEHVRAELIQTIVTAIRTIKRIDAGRFCK